MAHLNNASDEVPGQRLARRWLVVALVETMRSKANGLERSCRTVEVGEN